MFRLVDPQFVPRPEDLGLLQTALRSKLEKSPAGPSRQGRVNLSARLGEEAALALFSPLAQANVPVIDANTIRRNHPGFDYLLNGHLRVQVKCSTHYNCVQTSFKSDVQTAFDVLLMVDVGCMLDARFGPHRDRPLVSSAAVEYYVVPQSVVVAFLNSETCIVNGKGRWFYCFRDWVQAEMNPTRDFKGQYFDLHTWRSRWDVIEDALVRAA